MTQVSTEGRVFVAQLTRDIAARERAGANALAPGAKDWLMALECFGKEIANTTSPVKAGKAFRAGLERLQGAHRSGACFINAHMSRSRSGGFELLTWEVAKHPLISVGNEGVLVRSYDCMLRRAGFIGLGRSRLAFLSWHAIARMRERSKIDLFKSKGVAAACGVVGLLMRHSDKHANTGIYFASSEPLLCAGVLRSATDGQGRQYCFYDVLTAFQPNEDGTQDKQWAQGCKLSDAVDRYIRSDDADPSGHVDDIAVLPFTHDDFVSRELKRAS